MRLIRDILKDHKKMGKPALSCEFFPAKTAAGEKFLLENVIPRLLAIAPAFFSVTYGAGGSTRDQTLDVVDLIQRKQEVPTMAHLTCVGSTSHDIEGFLSDALKLGINNILAKKYHVTHIYIGREEKSMIGWEVLDRFKDWDIWNV